LLHIKIKYHTDIEKIKKIKQGDWIDLRCAEDTFIQENEYKLISLGISMELPKGYEAHIVPRSSTFKNFGIIQCNHMGIIDQNFSGDEDIWMFGAYCHEGKQFNGVNHFTLIKKNDRICQFRIIENQPEFEFKEVDFLSGDNRGGIGSTGVN
jgi:dUTP pyrophosphatase